MVAFFKVVMTELFALWQSSFALADFDCCNARLRIDSFNGCSNNFTELALKLNKSLTFFSLTNALTDNISCRRNRCPTEVLGINRNFNLIADNKFLSLVNLLSLLNSNLKVRIKNLVNYCFDKLCVKAVLFRINLEYNIFITAVVVLAGNGNCLFNVLKHIVHRNALFLFKCSQCFK